MQFHTGELAIVEGADTDIKWVASEHWVLSLAGSYTVIEPRCLSAPMRINTAASGRSAGLC
ncbi:hypothetical protein [Zhongshania sp.]|uniref:hypothetical protein n=1 Tax=Zhongshania sp. TaxID=1971902 RepID=UPI002A7F578E|nr:hypothetical protein [Zhongshania sp.]